MLTGKLFVPPVFIFHVVRFLYSRFKDGRGYCGFWAPVISRRCRFGVGSRVQSVLITSSLGNITGAPSTTNPNPLPILHALPLPYSPSSPSPKPSILPDPTTPELSLHPERSPTLKSPFAITDFTHPIHVPPIPSPSHPPHRAVPPGEVESGRFVFQPLGRGGKVDMDVDVGREGLVGAGTADVPLGGTDAA